MLLPLLRRRLRVRPTLHTVLRRIIPRRWTMVIRRALLNTHPLLMPQKDHTDLVAALAHARLPRHIRPWIKMALRTRTPQIITRPAAAAHATQVPLITRLNHPTLRRLHTRHPKRHIHPQHINPTSHRRRPARQIPRSPRHHFQLCAPHTTPPTTIKAAR